MKVKYIGVADEWQIQYGGHNDPRGILVEGRIYNVTCSDVRSSHTKLTLEGFPDLRFNSVCFEEVSDGTEK